MTRFSHHPPQPIASTTTPPRQRGYVLVTFALLLVPLLLLAGLSIDVGSWYNRASDMRKAADAAALAGVVWLPNEAAARSAAIETAARNGFVEGNGVSISVVPVPGTEKRLKVAFCGGTSAAITSRSSEQQLRNTSFRSQWEVLAISSERVRWYRRRILSCCSSR